MKNNKYSGVWIPKNVLKIGIKNGNERILFSMILRLSSNTACTASNKYLSERLQLSKGQISRLISELQKKNLVNIFVDGSNGNKRRITINNEYSRLCANMKIAIEDKSIPIRKDDDTLYADMPINNKEDNIYIKTTTTTEKLKSNINLIKSICKSKNISEEILFKQFENYSNFLVNTQKKIHPTDNDMYKHFLSWHNKQKLEVEFKYETDLKWFIDAFNKLSKKNFKITATLKKSFAKKRDEGFTSKEMTDAVSNLYSSSIANKWHKDRDFLFATPEFLLKDDNINRYLNARWGSSRKNIPRAKRLN
jgi:hypothetical protein